MAPKNVYEHLKAQWKPEWTTMPSVEALALYLDKIGNGAATIAAVKKQHVDAGKLTASGIRDKVRQTAASEVVPALKRARYALDGAKATVAAQRARMMDAPLDKSDIVGAMVRQEIRAKLAAMDQGQRMDLLLNGDQRIYDAWRELPTFVPVPDEFMANLQERRLEARDPVAMEQLREADEAINVVETMLRAATEELREAAEFEKRDPDFLAFTAEAEAAVKADTSMSIDDLVAQHRARHGLPMDATA